MNSGGLSALTRGKLYEKRVESATAKVASIASNGNGFSMLSDSPKQVSLDAANNLLENLAIDTISFDNEEELPRRDYLCGLVVENVIFDTSSLVGGRNPHRCILSQAVEGAGYQDCSEKVQLLDEELQGEGYINAAYVPTPTNGGSSTSSLRIAQRTGGPPMNKGITRSTDKSYFVRFCYPYLLKGKCDRDNCQYSHDVELIKAFVKSRPDTKAEA